MEETQSLQLLIRLENADENAAQEVFDRYADRLAGLAFRNLSSQLKRRVDPEDVVQSVYRSFFRRAEEGRFVLNQSGDLWRLLAAITIRKVKGQVEFHSAQKRNFSTEVDSDPTKTCVIAFDLAESEPSGEAAVVLQEELSLALSSLEKTARLIVELAMQGLSTEDISDQVARSARTVRRTIQDFRSNLEKRLLSHS